jgi:excisionase family DNA binding protein
METSATSTGGSIHAIDHALDSSPKIALSRKNAANYAGISVSSLDRMAQTGRIRPSLALRRVLYPVNELNSLLGLDPIPIQPSGNWQQAGLSRRDAASLLDVSVRTIDRLIERGLIIPTRFGRRVVITVEELMRFLGQTGSIQTGGVS